MTHIYKEEPTLERSDLHEGSSDSFEEAWLLKIREKSVSKAREMKALKFGEFYFGLDHRDRNMAYACKKYGIERKTGAGYMDTLGELGVILVGASPVQAGEATLPRVYRRRVFWTTDFWNF